MYLRIMVALLLGVGVVIACELAWLAASRPGDPAGPAPPVSAAGRPDGDDPALGRRVARLDLREADLPAALAALGREAGVNVVYPSDVAAAGKPIDLHLGGVTVAVALRAILDASDGFGADVDFVARDGVIFVGPPRLLDVRVYNVRDLAGERWPPAGPLPPGPPPDPGDVEKLGTGRQRIEQLAERIESAVAPGSWRENGGTGSVWEWNGFLVIAQTHRTHVAVAEFLAKLRAGSAAKPPTRAGP